MTAIAVLAMTAALADRGYHSHTATLRALHILPCAGCFGCWTRTPGECGIADDAVGLVRAYVESDVVVYVTPVTFGGYSSELKKAIDRIVLPTLDPRFKVVNGEVHHRLRYGRSPMTVVLGTLPSPDPEAAHLFAKLASRNGLNIHRKTEASVLVSETDPEAARRLAVQLLDRAGAK